MTTRMSWPLVVHSPYSPSLHPRQNVTIAPSMLVRTNFTNPPAKVTTGVSASHIGAAVAGTTSMLIDGGLASGGIATFATPRNVVITVTHATSVVAMSGVITGTDVYGNVITEAWSVAATGTSKTFTGAKAYKTITGITEVIAADASTNTIIAGSGDVLGLPFKNAIASAVKEVANGSVVTNGVLVAASVAAAADSRGTYAPNTVPTGSISYSVWTICESSDIQ